MRPILALAAITAGLSFVNSYLFVTLLGLGFIGAPIALCITYISFNALLLGYLRWTRIYEKTFKGLALKEAATDIWKFIKLGAGGIVMVCVLNPLLFPIRSAIFLFLLYIVMPFFNLAVKNGSSPSRVQIIPALFHPHLKLFVKSCL